MSEFLVAVMLWFGGGFMFVAAVGIVRMPDLYIRMHAATKVGTLGVSGLIAAGALHFQTSAVTTHAILITGFFLITAPVAAHMISRAAYHTGVPMSRHSVMDELGEHLRTAGKRGAVWLLLLGMTGLAGCATGPTDSAGAYDGQAVLRAANKLFSGANWTAAVEIPTAGPSADATFVALSQRHGPSQLAQDIASAIRKSYGSDRRMLLYGANSAKTAQVATDALLACTDCGLATFTLIFCGARSDFEALQTATPWYTGKLSYLPEP